MKRWRWMAGWVIGMAMGAANAAAPAPAEDAAAQIMRHVGARQLVVLAVVTMLPVAIGMSGMFYLGGATVLNLVFLWYAWKMQNPPDEMFNMKMFGYSIVYLMALFAFLMVDHWMLPWLA